MLVTAVAVITIFLTYATTVPVGILFAVLDIVIRKKKVIPIITLLLSSFLVFLFVGGTITIITELISQLLG